MTDTPQQPPDIDAALGMAATGSQPERLAVVARLRGLQPADAATARVLEIGCAAGVNLLPLAEREAGATFVGIDANSENIRKAAATAGHLGLANTQFLAWDVAAAGEAEAPDLGLFDYIIAHGQYSWLDPPRRDALLAVCRRHLAPRGVAYFSYNTYPGWHVHEMFAAMMRYDAREAATPAEEMRQARGLLEFLRASLTETDPHDALVQAELAWLLAQSDGYLRHEYLNEVSRPAYFRQFAEHAAGHALKPLGDLAIGLAAEDRLTPQAERQLSEIAVNAIEREQIRDVIRNRAVRQTLLCHADVSLTTDPASDVLEGMWLESQLRPETTDASPTSPGLVRYVAANGLRLATSVPLIKTALVRLGAAWPGFISMAELADLSQADMAQADRAAEGSATARDGDRGRLRDNLLHAALGGIVELHSRPQQFTVQITDRPCASPMARLQAERGNVVTNRKHQNVRLGDFDQHVLQLLDGARDRSRLLDELTAWTVSGRLRIQEQGQPVSDSARARQLIEAVLPEALANLARGALLIA